MDTRAGHAEAVREDGPMRITVLTAGPRSADFVGGLRDALRGRQPQLTAIASTCDDLTTLGLRVCPAIDPFARLLDAGGLEAQDDEARDDEQEGGSSAHRVAAGLAALGAGLDWLPIIDADLPTLLARSHWLAQGDSLSEITARMNARWGLEEGGLRVLPLTDEPVETHAVLDHGETQEAVHVEYWRRALDHSPAPSRLVVAGLDRATPAAGVLEAIRTADAVLLGPSQPISGIGVMLGVPGVRDALRGCSAPVIGVSPLAVGHPDETDAELIATLRTVGTEVSGRPEDGADSLAVAALYRDLADGWVLEAGASAAPRGPGLTRGVLAAPGRTMRETAAAALELAGV